MLATYTDEAILASTDKNTKVLGFLLSCLVVWKVRGRLRWRLGGTENESYWMLEWSNILFKKLGKCGDMCFIHLALARMDCDVCQENVEQANSLGAYLLLDCCLSGKTLCKLSGLGCTLVKLMSTPHSSEIEGSALTWLANGSPRPS